VWVFESDFGFVEVRVPPAFRRGGGHGAREAALRPERRHAGPPLPPELRSCVIPCGAVGLRSPGGVQGPGRDADVAVEAEGRADGDRRVRGHIHVPGAPPPPFRVT